MPFRFFTYCTVAQGAPPYTQPDVDTCFSPHHRIALSSITIHVCECQISANATAHGPYSSPLSDATALRRPMGQDVADLRRARLTERHQDIRHQGSQRPPRSRPIPYPLPVGSPY